MRRTLFFLILIFLPFTLAAQVPSVIEHIRFPVWAEADAYPGLLENADDEELSKENDFHKTEYDFAISRIKQVSPFIITGMVYGWDFVYTPSDKTRGVEEYFEITEKDSLANDVYRISYSSPWIADGKFWCWVDYTRSAYQIQEYNLWSSIQNPVMQGRGYASVEGGFDGIKAACEDALKNAVREHYRSLVKNKPKEITGSVLVRKIPVLGIDAGRYVINLDFFLEYGRIKEYTKF